MPGAPCQLLVPTGQRAVHAVLASPSPLDGAHTTWEVSLWLPKFRSPAPKRNASAPITRNRKGCVFLEGTLFSLDGETKTTIAFGVQTPALPHKVLVHLVVAGELDGLLVALVLLVDLALHTRGRIK